MGRRGHWLGIAIAWPIAWFAVGWATFHGRFGARIYIEDTIAIGGLFVVWAICIAVPVFLKFPPFWLAVMVACLCWLLIAFDGALLLLILSIRSG